MQSFFIRGILIFLFSGLLFASEPLSTTCLVSSINGEEFGNSTLTIERYEEEKFEFRIRTQGSTFLIELTSGFTGTQLSVADTEGWLLARRHGDFRERDWIQGELFLRKSESAGYLNYLKRRGHSDSDFLSLIILFEVCEPN